jgi:alpha/beta hydrolase fold
MGKTMTQHRQIIRGGSALILISAGITWAADQAPTPTPKAPLTLLPPQPLVPNAKVVTLWPAGSLLLKPLDGWDKPEVFNRSKGNPDRVDSVTNIHNPSIEVHLAPPDKATGMAVIVAPGGGNTNCVVGTEGIDIASWLNGLGVHAFIERYRLRPYGSPTDALADTQRCFRVIRANAKEWGVDPKRVGIMGFSAGGEQAALAALHFDEGKADAADPIERLSCRPDFTVLVYAGWRNLDLSQIPKDAPPAFLVSAGLGDASHAKRTVEFYDAYFQGNVPVELHIYAHGGHGGGIGSRKGIPFGTWHLRFLDWAKDQGFMTAPVAR